MAEEQDYLRQLQQAIGSAFTNLLDHLLERKTGGASEQSVPRPMDVPSAVTPHEAEQAEKFGVTPQQYREDILASERDILRDSGKEERRSEIEDSERKVLDVPKEPRGTGGTMHIKKPETFVGPSEEYREELEKRHERHLKRRMQPPESPIEEHVFEGQPPTMDAPATPQTPTAPPEEPRPTDTPPSSEMPEPLEIPELQAWADLGAGPREHPTIIDPPGHRTAGQQRDYVDRQERRQEQVEQFGHDRHGEQQIGRDIMDQENERHFSRHAHNRGLLRLLQRIVNDAADDERAIEHLDRFHERARVTIEDVEY